MSLIAGKNLCQRLVVAGWSLKRIKGTYHILGKPGDWKIITVPVHGGAAI